MLDSATVALHSACLQSAHLAKGAAADVRDEHCRVGQRLELLLRAQLARVHRGELHAREARPQRGHQRRRVADVALVFGVAEQHGDARAQRGRRNLPDAPAPVGEPPQRAELRRAAAVRVDGVVVPAGGVPHGARDLVDVAKADAGEQLGKPDVAHACTRASRPAGFDSGTV